MAERETTRHGYSRRNRIGRYAGAAIFAALALSCAAVALSNLGEPDRAIVFAALSFPVALLAWWTMRGALERRCSFIADSRGLSIVSLEGRTRSVQWEEIRALRHWGRLYEPHLQLRSASEGVVWKIHYDIGNAKELLESCAVLASAASDAYEIPIQIERPSLPRRLVSPAVIGGPLVALGVVGLVNGVVGMFIVCEGMVAAGLAVWFLVQAGQPSMLEVVEEGIGVQTRIRGREFIRGAELASVEFVFMSRTPAQPVVLISASSGRKLALANSTIDPIRLFGLLRRTQARLSRGETSNHSASSKPG